jgi:hypothetical protein
MLPMRPGVPLASHDRGRRGQPLGRPRCRLGQGHHQDDKDSQGQGVPGAHRPTGPKGARQPRKPIRPTQRGPGSLSTRGAPSGSRRRARRGRTRSSAGSRALTTSYLQRSVAELTRGIKEWADHRTEDPKLDHERRRDPRIDAQAPGAGRSLQASLTRDIRGQQAGPGAPPRAPPAGEGARRAWCRARSSSARRGCAQARRAPVRAAPRVARRSRASSGP